MPAKMSIVLLVLIGSASLCWATDPPSPPSISRPPLLINSAPKPIEVPPLALMSGIEVSGIPYGKTVSQPLQPVIISEPLLTNERDESAAKTGRELPLEPDENRRPFATSWTTLEYLLWWPKGQSLPPLITSNRSADAPVFGGPNTGVLVGHSQRDGMATSGGRITNGFAVNETGTAAIAATYFFLGTRTVTQSVSDSGHGRPRQLARPIINANTGNEDWIPVATPGRLNGLAEVSTSTRVSGWEVNGLVNLFTGPGANINAIAGYRYLMVNEGLRIEQTAFLPGTLAVVADQFDAHNRFHGGQFGFSADLARGPVYVEMVGKVGIGQSIGVVKISGQGAAVTPGNAQPLQYFTSGVLGQSTNSGRFVQTSFAVLPEAIVKVGYKFKDHSRVYFGYNFLYLSEAVHPGDQVDRTIDPSQVPLFARPGGTNGNTEHPVPLLTRSDFWLQGMMFGLEFRY